MAEEDLSKAAFFGRSLCYPWRLKPQSTSHSDVVDVRFHEPDPAQRDLQILSLRFSSDLLSTLHSLLRESPAPDQALRLLERLTGSHPELPAWFEKDRTALHYTLAIFGYSHWLAETLLREPEIAASLSRDKNLGRALDRADYNRCLQEYASESCELASLLARFKKREYIRIALRDILGIATLGEITGEISSLADSIISHALVQAATQMAARHGVVPGSFAVLALGKLGGNELNYSSDIDLLYLYRAENASAKISADEYFIRLAQTLTSILSQPNVEGAAFRIDLRLRPQGREGEPAVSLQHALDYYNGRAHDWELQALIKARHVSGDEQLAQSFLHGVHNRVYTEHLNFAAIETALRSREKMDARRLHGGRRSALPGSHLPNVKLDRGGIRDVEFLVQCLQRVYGGSEPWLCSGGTLFSLQKLHDKDHLPAADFQQLSQAYEFLRRVEHRLQLQRGHQAHTLPGHAEDLEVLTRELIHNGATSARSEPVLSAVRSCMSRVAAIYARVIRNEQQRSGRPIPLPFASSGKPQPGSPEMLSEVASGVPAFAGRLRELNEDGRRHRRRRLVRFLETVTTLPELGSLLVEDARLAERAAMILEGSDYLAELLIRHPELLQLLGEDSSDARTETASSHATLSAAMTGLRREFRSGIFKQASADILNAPPAFNSMRATTRLAENAIRHALQSSGSNDAIAVFALGRLGTREFDIASDADLLFVRASSADQEPARLVAENIVQLLSAYTREGALFAVDARLRPHGGEGELVITPERLDRYLAAEAQPWEALSYTKLRFIAGHSDLAEPLLAQARRRRVEIAQQPGFAGAVLDMRARLERANRYRHSFKLARGGFYDIDFIASYLMLREPSLHDGNTYDGNTMDRLRHLHQQRLLSDADLATLEQAAVLYRTVDHAIRVVTGNARPELPQIDDVRRNTEALAERILARDRKDGIQAELDETQALIRAIFSRLINA